jgi:hypothetical protein
MGRVDTTLDVRARLYPYGNREFRFFLGYDVARNSSIAERVEATVELPVTVYLCRSAEGMKTKTLGTHFFFFDVSNIDVDVERGDGLGVYIPFLCDETARMIVIYLPMLCEVKVISQGCCTLCYVKHNCNHKSG